MKKLTTSVVTAALALTLTTVPASAQSSFNMLSSGSSTAAPSNPSNPSNPSTPTAPVKTRAQVAADIKQRIIAANQRLGHTYSTEMESRAKKFADHAVRNQLNYRPLATGIDATDYTDNYVNSNGHIARTKGVIIRVKDGSVNNYLRSLYTIPDMSTGVVKFPFGVWVNPATGEYYIAISARLG